MTTAYQRIDGKLESVEVPNLACPTRGCGCTLLFLGETFQHGLQGQVAWNFECANSHRYFQIQPDGVMIRQTIGRR